MLWPPSPRSCLTSSLLPPTPGPLPTAWPGRPPRCLLNSLLLTAGGLAPVARLQRRPSGPPEGLAFQPPAIILIAVAIPSQPCQSPFAVTLFTCSLSAHPLGSKSREGLDPCADRRFPSFSVNAHDMKTSISTILLLTLLFVILHFIINYYYVS
ncbi:hypothetical protein HJG60_008388 [Phyllostomus discolor]|uniref:Uncharacterized protein n=1 Tax=Phyllostomus discolor TaxID=89673 RepID=A0A834DQD0_9CHIR|nr:hypothetical protein HJG60_008388 [Phyllostomus discolor]